jgi:hypothetical protein
VRVPWDRVRLIADKGDFGGLMAWLVLEVARR